MPQTLLTISHRIARVTLHAPPVNALTQALLTQLKDVFEKLEADDSVKVILLTGSEKVFSAGADIRALAQMTTRHDGSAFSTRGQACMNRIERCEKPVIAAINGACLGGGLELALACHIRIAATGISLGLPETTLGLIPGFGGTQRLTRLIGAPRATELILTGQTIRAEHAAAIGLVNRVVPATDLIQEAERLAGALVARGRHATRAALLAIRAGLDGSPAEGLARESELFGGLCETPDKKEGVQAFLEKRAPRLMDTDPSHGKDVP